MMLSAVVVAVALAQVTTEDIPLEAAFLDAAEAYREGPTADRVSLTLREGRRERTESYTVRLEPLTPGSSRVGSLRLDLNEIHAWMGDGRLVVVHDIVGDAVLVRSFGGGSASEALAGVLPPLVLPGLAALEGGLRRGDLGPLVPKVTWDSAQADFRSGRGVVVVSGATENGDAGLVHDGRIFEFGAPLRGAGTRIEIDCRGVEPGDPASWEIPTDGLARVTTLRELLTHPGPIAVGDALSEFPIEDGAGGAWSVESVFARSAAPEYAALLLYRAGFGADALDGAGSMLTRLEQELTRPAGPMLPAQVRRFAWRPTVVGEPGDEDRARWNERGLLIAWSSARSIDRLAPGSRGVVVVVGEDGRVAAVIDAGDAEEIERAVRALFPEPVDPLSEE